MSEATHHAYCAEYRPSIWNRLGFCSCSAPCPDADEFAEGWAPSWLMVETRVHLGWKDRLRVLISGNLMTDCAVKTDVPIARSRATSVVSVLPPGRIRP
jgi:hypothetical protein